MLDMQTNHSNMSDERLLEAFLPQTAVNELVASYGTVKCALANAMPEELERLNGIGPVKARQLRYITELARRLYRDAAAQASSIRSPQDVFERMRDMQSLCQEEFRALYLTTKNGIIAERTITIGTVNSTIVSPREIFAIAVRLMAVSVILVHNHPSGDPAPSKEDIEVTRRIAEAGRIMEIAILDHCIIGSGRFISLKEEGVL